MILFYARKRYAICSSDDKLTTGSVGIEVAFHFSDDWAVAPSRIAVFRGSGVSVDVALLEDSCTVPPEVLTQPGSTLTIGVYGTDGAGTVVIPTVYAEAGQIKRGAEPSGIEPTPQTQPLIDQLLAAAQAARNAADEAERLAKSVKDAADAGEFDGDNGDDGNGIWWTVSFIDDESMPGQVYGKIRSSWLKGRSGAPAVHDLVVGPAVGTSGSIGWLYEIISVSGIYCNLHGIGSIKSAPGDPGADGYAPEVTIEQIDGGHRVTITSADYPEGQSFDVMDGTGGGVTVDDALSGSSTNPVQNKVVKAALDGKGTYSKPASGIPATDLEETYVQESVMLDIIDEFNNQLGNLGIGKADKPKEVTVDTDGAVTQWMEANTIYHFTGNLTALTLTLRKPDAGQQAQYHLDFLSGATAPTVTIPATVTMPDGWTVEANTRYEVDILDGFGVAQSWEVTA